MRFIISILSRDYVQGRVVYVVDGDSIHLKVGREKHKVRLTGIDTPESNQPWGYEAGKALKKKRSLGRKLLSIQMVLTDMVGC